MIKMKKCENIFIDPSATDSDIVICNCKDVKIINQTEDILCLKPSDEDNSDSSYDDILVILKCTYPESDLETLGNAMKQMIELSYSSLDIIVTYDGIPHDDNTENLASLLTSLIYAKDNSLHVDHIMKCVRSILYNLKNDYLINYNKELNA